MDVLIAFCNDSGSTMKETLELNEEELQVCLEMMNYKNLRKAKIVNQWRKEKKEFDKKSAAKRWLANKRSKEGRQQSVENAVILQLDPGKRPKRISHGSSGQHFHTRKNKSNPGVLVLSKSSLYARKIRPGSCDFGLSQSTHSARTTPTGHNALTSQSNHETNRRQSTGVLQVKTTEKSLAKYNSFEQVMDKHQNIATEYRKKYGKEVEVTTIYRPGLPSVTVLETSEHRRKIRASERVAADPLNKLNSAKQASQFSSLGMKKPRIAPNQEFAPQRRVRSKASSAHVRPTVVARIKRRVRSTSSLQSAGSQPIISTQPTTKWWDLSEKSETAAVTKGSKKMISSTNSVQSSTSRRSTAVQNAKWELSKKRPLPESSKLACLLKTMDLESTAAGARNKLVKARKKKAQCQGMDLKQATLTKKKNPKSRSKSLADIQGAEGAFDGRLASRVASSKASIRSGCSVSLPNSSVKSARKTTRKEKKAKKGASNSSSTL